MTDSGIQSGRQPVVESPIFKLVVQAAVPVLLGVLVTLAISINATQREQGDKLSAMDGSLKVIVQQNSDFGGAIEDYSAALALKPDHPFALLGRAICRLVRASGAATLALPSAVCPAIPAVVLKADGRRRRLAGKPIAR